MATAQSGEAEARSGLAQAWAAGTVANHGVLLRQGTESDTAAWWRFYGMDWTDPTHLPSLAVTYNHPPATPTGPATAPPAACATGTGRPLLNTTTPQLAATVADPDGGLVQAKFTITPVGGSTPVASGTSTAVTTGGQATWTPPAGTLTNGASYTWQATGWDGSLTSAAAGACEFTVDTTTPAAPAVASTDYPSGAWLTAGGPGSFTLTDTSTDVDHYLWSIDNPTPATAAASPLRFTPGDGWHTLSVRAVDAAGNLSPVTTYIFGTAPGLTSPVEARRPKARSP